VIARVRCISALLVWELLRSVRVIAGGAGAQDAALSVSISPALVRQIYGEWRME